jgi:hypothetical protein
MVEDVNLLPLEKRRLVRVVEGARLESVYTGNRIEGSNPSVSAFARRSFSKGGIV